MEEGKRGCHVPSAGTFINNKNVVSVNTSSCRRPRKKYKGSRVVSDEICGRIFQSCCSQPKVYWKAVGLKPSGSIRITNDSECCKMIVMIRFKDCDKIIREIDPCQQVAFLVKSINSISIKCIGHSENCCEGTYALRLHYLLSPSRK